MQIVRVLNYTLKYFQYAIWFAIFGLKKFIFYRYIFCLPILILMNNFGFPFLLNSIHNDCLLGFRQPDIPVIKWSISIELGVFNVVLMTAAIFTIAAKRVNFKWQNNMATEKRRRKWITDHSFKIHV
jgi:hypothetical protein